MKAYQDKARRELKECGAIIARQYTFGCGGPLPWALEMFPYIEPRVQDLKGRISDLPICAFQSRDLHPKSMVTAIAYRGDDGNPMTTRLLPTGEIEPEMIDAITRFAQGFWFLIHSGALPSPREDIALKRALLELTSTRLIMA